MKVAVVGAGFGERVMAVVYRRLGFDVEVIPPRDHERIARACAQSVDLVSIHSPPFLHQDHVLLALDHGRNVLCDKPFGRDAAQARSMRDRAKEAGVLHFLNFEFRHHPGRAKAKELLESGVIGTLQHINWTFIGAGLRKQAFRWLFDKDQSGGWIGAYGSHAIDTMRYLFGKEIAGCGGVMRTETGSRVDRDGVARKATAEDAYSAWFMMDGGGTVSMDTAYSAPVNLPHRINLMGSEGAIEIINDIEVTVHRPGAEKEIHVFPASDWDLHEPGLTPWLTQVRDALRSGRQIAPSFEDGVAVAEVMDRLRATMINATRSE